MDDMEGTKVPTCSPTFVIAGGNVGIKTVGEAGDIKAAPGDRAEILLGVLRVDVRGERGLVGFFGLCGAVKIPGTAARGDAGRNMGEGMIIGSIVLLFTFLPFTII